MKARILILTVAVLAGCAGMSGYDAKTSFACKAPDGVLCESMSGIYANAMQKNLPGQRINRRNGDGQSGPQKFSPAKERVMTPPIHSGTPIRSPPHVLRVWVAPWEDSDGDLHDQSYLYLTVDTGDWLIEHNRRRLQDAYRPVRAPAPAAAPPPDQRDAASGLQPAGSRPESTVQTSSGKDLIGIGGRQDRPTDEQAAAWMGGIVQPDSEATP